MYSPVTTKKSFISFSPIIMKHQKNLPMYDLVRKTIREKTHSLQEKKRSFGVYLQKELGEILSAEDIATIFSQKRILMTKKFKEEEQ